MKRFGLFLTLLMCAFVGAGCLASNGQDVVYDQRYPGDRRAPRDHGRYYDRLHRDTRDYVHTLDYRLRLDHRQEWRIRRLLEERAERLLARTHPRDHAYVYPFPRRFDHRRQSEQVERWWHTTDREIERYLDRRQRDEYRYLTGRDDHRYDRRDRRYDNRRHRGDDDDDDGDDDDD